MRLSVIISPAECAEINKLAHTHGEWFSMGYVLIGDGTLRWRPAVGGALLEALQKSESFRIEGSPAQTLFGKVLRIHQHHVN